MLLNLQKGMPSPGTKKERPRPKTHKPAPTQGEGCVKGGPSAGPPFAFNQGTDQVFAGGMRSPRHQKRTPPWGRSFLVRKMGLEPTHKMYWLLRPARLPFRHFRRKQLLSYHDRSPAVKPGDENRWALAALRLDRRQPAFAAALPSSHLFPPPAFYGLLSWANTATSLIFSKPSPA